MTEETKGTVFENMSAKDIESFINQVDVVKVETPVQTFQIETKQDNLPAVAAPAENKPMVVDTQDVDTTLDDDFKEARTSLAELVKTGEDAIRDLAALAKASDQPRAYEVLANTLQTVASLNKDRLEIHTKKADIEKKKNGGIVTAGGTNIQNNLFVGSTAELQKLIGKQVIELEDKS